MLKLILLLCLSLLLPVNCFANELHNYGEIKNAVLSGKTLHIVIDFLKCSTSNNKRGDSIRVGVFEPSAVQVLTNHIATSFKHFTRHDPNFPEKPVFEYVRYLITDHNDVILTYETLDAVNYQILSDKISFLCKIDAAAKFYI